MATKSADLIEIRPIEIQEALLEQALRELAWFQKKYECLAELADVFDAIEAARKEAGVA